MHGKLKVTMARKVPRVLAVAVMVVCGANGVRATQEPQDNSPVLGLKPAHVGQVFSLPPNAGAPFTATVEFETTQVLSDRTVVVHRSKSFVARDSKGRTRNELRENSPTGQQETVQVILYNPETKVRTTLSPKASTARQATVKPSEFVGDLGQIGAAGSPASRAAAQKNAAAAEIGVDYMDGMEVRHFRERHIVPVGLSANEGQIEAVYEYWYSRELKVNLLSKKIDARAGAQSARLKEIKRGEPDRALFEIPAGYTIIASPPPARLNP